MKKQFDFDKIRETKKYLFLNKLEDKKLLLAVSGGVDSIVLAHHLSKIHPHLAIAHFHHGITNNKKTNLYRNHVQKFSQKLACELNVSFFTNKPQKKLSKQSEESLREARNQFLQKICKQNGFFAVAKAHHADDLLETRLIRLIRGVGSDGFTAMRVFDLHNFRPLLSWSKVEVLEYAKKYKLSFCEDPSNKNKDYLRNWIRNDWLKSLEKKRAGSRSRLAKSFENLAKVLESQTDQDFLKSVFSDDKIVRASLLVLPKYDQRRVLARYFQHLRVKNYTVSQIDEILKRLDGSQKELTFTVAKCQWKVDTRHIQAQVALRPSSSS